jgi:hypothetical protein
MRMKVMQIGLFALLRVISKKDIGSKASGRIKEQTHGSRETDEDI